MHTESREQDLRETVRTYFRSRSKLSSYCTEDEFVKKVMEDATMAMRQTIDEKARHGENLRDEDVWCILKIKVEECQILDDPTNFK